MSKILMVASEAAPYAKTGGLSDVLGALPRALRDLGHQVAVLLPRYAQTKPFSMRRIWGDLPVQLGPRTYFCSILQSEVDTSYLFLDVPELYNREGLYSGPEGDYPDNHLRFGLLARAAFEVIRLIFPADILHCHDWQAGLAPVFLKRLLNGDPTFSGVRTLTTIHNLGYQGLFPAAYLTALGLPADVFQPEGLEFYGQVSFLKAGLQYSDALSTVSEKYAEEIQTPEYGFALEGLLSARKSVLHGILNGVDYNQWNPATDSNIPRNYARLDVAGKRKCKAALLKEFGLPASATDKPLIGIVSRFTAQKGFDLIAAAASRLFDDDFYLVVLGNGEAAYEKLFRSLASSHGDRVGLRVGFDEGLAHRIEAGADIFLMPSQYEPCGLNQIYSLKYGTVPVVRATGGLDDTIDADTGFKFTGYEPEEMLVALHSAIDAYADRKQWRTLMRNGMGRDYSWSNSAREYGKLYRSLLNPNRG